MFYNTFSRIVPNMVSVGLFCTSLVLAALLTPVHCCDWLNSYHYHKLNNNSVTLLEQMGDAMSEADSPVPFPYFMYKRMERAERPTQLVFIRDNLKLLLGLYRHDNLSSASWDAVKTEHFLITLETQVNEISGCVSENVKADCRQRRYYNKLRSRTLSVTGGSSATWEIIRSETGRHLKGMLLLVNKMLSAASRGRPTQSPRLYGRLTTRVETSAPC